MKNRKLSEETMPYALDDKGRIGIDNEDVIDNINSLLTGVTSKSFETPYNALEKIRKVLANFHIHIPKYTFDEGDDDYAVFEISQFGLKAGMTNDGQFVKNTDEKNYLYFEYKLNAVGNYAVFSEIVDEDDLSELINDRESEADDEDDDAETYSHTQETDHAINKDEHKGLRYTMSESKDAYHDSYTSAINTAIEHAAKRGYNLADGERDNIATGPKKPGRGKTVSHSLSLVDSKGKPSKKRLHIQVYNRETDTNPYELNHYISEDVKPKTLKEHLTARGWKLLND